MTAKVIIPVYSHKEILKDILNFYAKHLEEATVFVVNDNPKESLNAYNKYNAIISNNIINGDLRHTFHHYTEYTQTTAMVITNEHDVMPNVDALYAGIALYYDMIGKMKLASVSFVYTLNGELCYPSHKNWFKDDRIEVCSHFGRVSVVRSQGVPFGFTLWNAEALSMVGDPSLPKIWKLDSKFGELLASKGYKHLRMLDYNVEHQYGGVNSWKDR